MRGRSTRTDQRDGFSPGHAKREAREHRIALRVTEADATELDVALDHRQRTSVGPLDDLRVGVEQVEQTLGAGARLLTDGDQRGEHPDWRHELHHVGGEGQERAQREMAVHRQPSAEAEHRDLREHRNRLEHRCVPGLQLDEASARPEQPSGGVGQVLDLAVLLAEPLHDAHAGDRFVDHPRDFTGALLRVPARRKDRGAQAQCHRQHRRHSRR